MVYYYILSPEADLRVPDGAPRGAAAAGPAGAADDYYYYYHHY